MTENISRRTVIRGAAWSVPVIAAAVAVPMAAASTAQPTKDRLTFNTKTTWDENKNGTVPHIGVIVSAMDVTGPDAVGMVTLTVTISYAGGSQTKSLPFPIVRGWGDTGDWKLFFTNVPSGEYTVLLTASAEGVTTISHTMNGKTGKMK